MFSGCLCVRDCVCPKSCQNDIFRWIFFPIWWTNFKWCTIALIHQHSSMYLCHCALFEMWLPGRCHIFLIYLVCSSILTPKDGCQVHLSTWQEARTLTQQRHMSDNTKLCSLDPNMDKKFSLRAITPFICTTQHLLSSKIELLGQC